MSRVCSRGCSCAEARLVPAEDSGMGLRSGRGVLAVSSAGERSDSCWVCTRRGAAEGAVGSALAADASAWSGCMGATVAAILQCGIAAGAWSRASAGSCVSCGESMLRSMAGGFPRASPAARARGADGPDAWCESTRAVCAGAARDVMARVVAWLVEGATWGLSANDGSVGEGSMPAPAALHAISLPTSVKCRQDMGDMESSSTGRGRTSSLFCER